MTSKEFGYSKGANSLDPNCHKQWPICEDKTGKYENAACMYRSCAPRVEHCIEMLADDQFRKTVLDHHNKLRNKIASGNDRTGNNEAASNMRALSYDLGLEYTSICHVHGCLMEHDKCRSTSKFDPVGQNLGLISTTTSLFLTEEDIKEVKKLGTIIQIINSWYEEINVTDFTKSIEHYIPSEETGHFTQLIWAESTHIGCARAYIISNATDMTTHLTCNYGPAGNYRTLPIYKKGPGCSNCPYGVPCNTEYRSLCGKIDNTDLIAGINPYRAADIARGNQNSLHGSITSICSVYIFIAIRFI